MLVALQEYKYHEASLRCLDYLSRYQLSLEIKKRRYISDINYYEILYQNIYNELKLYIEKKKYFTFGKFLITDSKLDLQSLKINFLYESDIIYRARNKIKDKV